MKKAKNGPLKNKIKKLQKKLSKETKKMGLKLEGIKEVLNFRLKKWHKVVYHFLDGCILFQKQKKNNDENRN